MDWIGLIGEGQRNCERRTEVELGSERALQPHKGRNFMQVACRVIESEIP
jgi:hypothetical protein